MPLDLTKPIRRKADGQKVRVTKGFADAYLIEGYSEDAGFWYTGTINALPLLGLERFYENVPDRSLEETRTTPRKPQELFAYYRPDRLAYEATESEEMAERGATCYDHTRPVMRMVEWPLRAPLPDWPEGY